MILPSLISTTAHDGPIEPCVWMAKSYVAAMRFGASASALRGVADVGDDSIAIDLGLRT